MFKKSGNPKVLEITKFCKDRSTNLTNIGPIQLEELSSKGKKKRLCAWCALIEIDHGNRKYCSKDCNNSAMAWANPQKEDALRFLLEKQGWKCAHCQFDYTIDLLAILKREFDKYPAERQYHPKKFEDLPWYYFKRLKTRTSKEHKPEIDHILAISKGGDSLGLDNHQVLCFTCHKVKTKVDLSGKRTKKS